MKALVTLIAKALVDKPEEVAVEEERSGLGRLVAGLLVVLSLVLLCGAVALLACGRTELPRPTPLPPTAPVGYRSSDGVVVVGGEVRALPDDCPQCGTNDDFAYSFRVSDPLDYEDYEDLPDGTPADVTCDYHNQAGLVGVYSGSNEYRYAVKLVPDGDGWLLHGLELAATVEDSSHVPNDDVVVELKVGSVVTTTVVQSYTLDVSDLPYEGTCQSEPFYFGDCDTVTVPFTPSVYLNAGWTYYLVLTNPDTRAGYHVSVWDGDANDYTGTGATPVDCGYYETAVPGWTNDRSYYWYLPDTGSTVVATYPADYSVLAFDGEEATPTPTGTLTTEAWVSEVLPRPMGTGTPCAGFLGSYQRRVVRGA